MNINYKNIIKTAIGIAVLTTLLVAGAGAQSNAVSADIHNRIQDAPLKLQDVLQLSGKLEATGTHFVLNNTRYLNITLDSLEPIKLALESIPEMVTMHIESASDATSTQINLSGFAPETTYHKYEDNYHSHALFTTDANGNYTYTQDISRKHLVFIQPIPSTIFINDNATGGDCALIPIGIWNAATRTCKLNTDLTETIQIDSDGITLDGNWHTSTGSGTGSGVYLPGRIGVTVKNMNIKQFTYGIDLDSSTNNTLSGNNASNNYISIYLGSSGNNSLTNNLANSNSYGIYLGSSGNNSLTNNLANSNSYYGIYLGSSGNNSLTNNLANSNSYYGIYLGSSNNNSLTNNNMTNNTYNFRLDGWQDSDFNNSIDASNTVDGRAVYYVKNGMDNNYDSSTNAGTFYCIWCDNVTIKDLTLIRNGFGIFFWNTNNSTIESINSSSNQYGIYLGSSGNNSLTNNLANSNSYGILLSSSGNNSLTNNLANSNSYGIYLGSSGNNSLTNNLANSNSYGIYLSSSGNNSLTNNNMTNNTYNFRLDGWQDSDFNNSIDASNTVDGRAVYYVKNGMDSIYDSSTNAGTFYCIWCDNVTIKDLTLIRNGFGIFFWNTSNSTIESINSSSNQYGIYLGSSGNNNLTNNLANSNSYGIYLSSAGNNNLTNNLANSNSYGIYLSSSGNNNLTNNLANSNSYGIRLSSSGNNSLTNNSANSNSYGILLSSSGNNSLTSNLANSNSYGILLSSSGNNSLTNNLANSNTYYGIYLGSSGNNSLTNNLANSNTYYGIYLGSSGNNSLTNNLANSNSYGIYLSSSGNNSLTNNNMTNNTYNFRLDGWQDSDFNNSIDASNTVDGRAVYYVKNGMDSIYDRSTNAGTFYCIWCDNVTIKDLTLIRNGFGIFFWNTSNSTIESINSSSNQYGIYLGSSGNNNLTNNLANSNSYGIYLGSSGNNNLTNNLANSNSYGIYLSSSGNNNLTNNLANSNTYYGIYLSSSGNNSLTNNMANSNSYGILLSSSANNNLTNNSARLNDWYGIYLSYSSNNNLINNIATNNSWDFFSTGNSLNTVTNLDIGSIVSFESKDVALKNSAAPIIASSTGKPGIEIHVAASNNDGSYQTVGISDGTTGNRDINSFGPAAANFAGARSYTFDASGNPVEAIIPLSIETLSSPTTEILSDDQVSAPIALPFPVNMYGRANNYIRISSNGFIFLNNDPPLSANSGCCSGQDLIVQTVTSGDDFLIAGTWNDLYPPGSGSITYGTKGTAPDRVFIIYFNNISNCCDSDGGYTFQIKLFENSTSTKSDPAPIGFQNIGKFIKATNNSANSWLFLNVSYNDSDVTGVNENLLRMWKNNGLWSQVPGMNGVNTAQKYVYANITGFSIFAPMGQLSVESSTGNGTVYFATDAGIIKNLTAARVSDIPQPPPDGLNFYYGLFRFNITGLSPGGSANLTLTFPDDLSAETTYWKNGNTSTNPTPHWYSIPSTINGRSLTITFTDGGIGDDDLTANGNIKDPGGPSIGGFLDDIAIFQSNGWWALKYDFNSTSNFAGADKWTAFGDGAAKPVVGDFRHTGTPSDVAILQSNGWWAIKYDFNNAINGTADKWIAFGDGTAKPVVGDFDHDGFKDDVAILQSNGWWAIKYDFVNTTNFAGADKWIAFGDGTAKPVVEDFNGDGFADDVAILQSNGWWALKYNFNSTSNFAGADKWIAFGDGTAKPVVGDFERSGTQNDVAILQSNGWWAIKYNFNSTSNFAGADKWIAFGDGTAQPVVGNFNDN